MRTPSSLVVVASVGLAAAACSRSQPADRRLDLVLDGYSARPTHVASALEIWGKAKATPAAPTRSEGLSAPLHAHRKARTRHLALLPRRARVPERAPVLAQPTVAAAPAPVQTAAPAAVPAPDPGPPQPSGDPQPGHGWGGWPQPTDGGGRFPGFPGGGVIIIRGGHGGDPCDEHGRGGIGGIPLPIPGGIGRGFPRGGIRFLRGR